MSQRQDTVAITSETYAERKDLAQCWLVEISSETTKKQTNKAQSFDIEFRRSPEHCRINNFTSKNWLIN